MTVNDDLYTQTVLRLQRGDSEWRFVYIYRFKASLRWQSLATCLHLPFKRRHWGESHSRPVYKNRLKASLRWQSMTTCIQRPIKGFIEVTVNDNLYTFTVFRLYRGESQWRPVYIDRLRIYRGDSQWRLVYIDRFKASSRCQSMTTCIHRPFTAALRCQSMTTCIHIPFKAALRCQSVTTCIHWPFKAALRWQSWTICIHVDRFKASSSCQSMTTCIHRPFYGFIEVSVNGDLYTSTVFRLHWGDSHWRHVSKYRFNASSRWQSMITCINRPF